MTSVCIHQIQNLLMSEKVVHFVAAMMIAGVMGFAAGTTSHQKHVDENKERMKRWDESFNRVMKAAEYKRSEYKSPKPYEPPYSTRNHKNGPI